MKTILNIPLRFGDPAISIAQNSNTTAYGTAYGKVDVINLESEDIKTLSEISEEFIASISLSPAGTLTYSVGDFYVYQYESPYSKAKSSSQPYSRIHTIEDCSNALTFLQGSNSCLVPTNGSNIYLLNISDRTCKLHNPLPPNSIPLAYHNDIILIEHFLKNGSRKLSHFYFERGICEEIYTINRNIHISHARIFKGGICFIENSKHLNVYNYLAESLEVAFSSFKEIVAFDICEVGEEVWAAFVTNQGEVCVLKDWKDVTSGEILYQGSVVKDFDSGYPYCLAIFPPYVSVSSDHFVHILKFSTENEIN